MRKEEQGQDRTPRPKCRGKYDIPVDQPETDQQKEVEELSEKKERRFSLHPNLVRKKALRIL